MFASWFTHILPFVEQTALYAQMQPNTESLGKQVKIYACPSDAKGEYLYANEWLTTSYTGVAGLSNNQSGPEYPTQMKGILYWRSKVKISDVKDGTSNTVMVGERPADPTGLWGWWDTTRQYYINYWEDATSGVHNNWSFYGYDSVFGSCPSGASAGIYRAPRGPLGTNMCDFDHFWSWHPGGAMFTRVDGSVFFLQYTAGPTVLDPMGTKADNDNIPNY
jgi:hypothetical protein